MRRSFSSSVRPSNGPTPVHTAFNHLIIVYQIQNRLNRRLKKVAYTPKKERRKISIQRSVPSSVTPSNRPSRSHITFNHFITIYQSLVLLHFKTNKEQNQRDNSPLKYTRNLLHHHNNSPQVNPSIESDNYRAIFDVS